MEKMREEVGMREGRDKRRGSKDEGQVPNTFLVDKFLVILTETRRY